MARLLARPRRRPWGRVVAAGLFGRSGAFPGNLAEAPLGQCLIGGLARGSPAGRVSPEAQPAPHQARIPPTLAVPPPAPGGPSGTPQPLPLPSACPRPHRPLRCLQRRRVCVPMPPMAGPAAPPPAAQHDHRPRRSSSPGSSRARKPTSSSAASRSAPAMPGSGSTPVTRGKEAGCLELCAQ